MIEECIHRDRLMFEMQNSDKTNLGEAIHWWKKMGNPQDTDIDLKIIAVNGMKVQNEQAK